MSRTRIAPQRRGRCAVSGALNASEIQPAEAIDSRATRNAERVRALYEQVIAQRDDR